MNVMLLPCMDVSIVGIGPTCGVHNALGLAGRARGVEQEQWVL